MDVSYKHLSMINLCKILSFTYLNKQSLEMHRTTTFIFGCQQWLPLSYLKPCISMGFRDNFLCQIGHIFYVIFMNFSKLNRDFFLDEIYFICYLWINSNFSLVFSLSICYLRETPKWKSISFVSWLYQRHTLVKIGKLCHLVVLAVLKVGFSCLEETFHWESY